MSGWYTPLCQLSAACSAGIAHGATLSLLHSRVTEAAEDGWEGRGY